IPDFAIASETHWDRAFPYVDASYARYFGADHLPTVDYTFPEFRATCCVTGPADFGLVNNCLRYRHIINLEPRCLHGSTVAVPHTARGAAAARPDARARRRRGHGLSLMARTNTTRRVR